MSARPYTEHDLRLLRESSAAADRCRPRSIAGSSDLARWLATLDEVTRERDEARQERQDAYRSNADHHERCHRLNHEAPVRPILYTDEIGGKQACVDNLWAITTQDLNAYQSALAAAQAELREAREALEKVWAAIGDALCSGTGIDKAYSQAVASEVRAFLSRPASDGALREMMRDAAREAWDAGHNAGSDGVNGPAADEQRDDDGEAIVSEIMEGK